MLWLALIVMGAPVATMIWAFNRMAALAGRCDRARADIDVQLRHRHNLLPNLLESVRGFAGHERAIFETIAAARATARSGVGEQKACAESVLTSAVAQLLSAAQAYPEIKSSSHFHALGTEIADTEHRIAAAQRFLNAATDEYNAALRQFPTVLVARFRPSYRQRAFFDLGVERVLLEDAPALKF